jgi:phage/plasmid-associated DNA primase
VIDKSIIKINTLWFYGPSNAGKSLIVNSIVESARFYCNIMDFDERTYFPLNDAPGKRVVLTNEPDIVEWKIELIKNIMEGQDVSINVKTQRGITLPRTPLVFCLKKKHYMIFVCKKLQLF